MSAVRKTTPLGNLLQIMVFPKHQPTHLFQSEATQIDHRANVEMLSKQVVEGSFTASKVCCQILSENPLVKVCPHEPNEILQSPVEQNNRPFTQSQNLAQKGMRETMPVEIVG